ncbi:MFS transporter [Burkholderia multivorans]|nr:MFS transporter [Burkholderia multivorans]
MDIEASAMRKVRRRYVPLLFVCFVIAFLDRVNVGFAALTMNRDIGLTATTFGLGAGLFFISYFLLEVPSNLMLERFGARRWIARIMLTWGVLSACMALVQGEKSFYLIRLLLGAAEAGFNPGIIFFFTLWIPRKYRAGVIASFSAAMPVASVLGSPTASLLLQMEGVLGLHGWQWMFIIDALPAVILAPVVLKVLTDHPRDAAWLTAAERRWLVETLEAEREQAPINAHVGLFRFLLSPRMLLLAIAFFGIVGFNYGLSFFLPQNIHQFGLTVFQTGLVNAVPFALATAMMMFWGRHSDARKERRVHLLVATVVAALSLAASTLSMPAAASFVLLCLAVMGTFSALTVFWAYISDSLGAGAAAGIAFINSIGNISGFAYLYMVGTIKDLTGTFAGGLQIIAAMGLVAAMIVVSLRLHAGDGRRSEQAV